MPCTEENHAEGGEDNQGALCHIGGLVHGKEAIGDNREAAIDPVCNKHSHRGNENSKDRDQLHDCAGRPTHEGVQEESDTGTTEHDQ